MVEEVMTRGGAHTSSDLIGIGRAGFGKPEPLASDQIVESDGNSKRLDTGIGELNRVLGGGLIADSFTLIGGDPGIGKSTLLLQLAKGICEVNPDFRFLYASGEESIDQIRLRSKRLGLTDERGQVSLLSETQLESVLAAVDELKPHAVVIDSLQTFSTSALESAPGSVSQLREITSRLMQLAKNRGIAIFLVGHVTKDGNIAGPKVVEHMVDTVLYFEGENGNTFRLLRTVKNRFGSTRELGVFEMDGAGLVEVSNPSLLFLNPDRPHASGTAVTASVEGTRPILVELQALVTGSTLAVPRRTAVGMESTRVALLAAILEKHLKLGLATHDLFFNVAGGLRLSEPACDLAAAAAIWSSYEDRALPLDWIFLGELGLTGEVRRVSQLDLRLMEAKKLGFKTAIIPQASLSVLDRAGPELKKGFQIKAISKVSELSTLLK